jgi:hypothetical protein
MFKLMKKYLINKIFRLVLFIFFQQRGAVVNSFKSITSPNELKLQKSKVMQSRVEEFRSLIYPIIVKKEKLKRYGSVGDGGYVLPINAVDKSKFLISGGIENNNDFEVNLARLGITGIQIDNSIDKPPILHKNLSFVRATLGNSHEVDIDGLIARFGTRANGILKLDIEGAEYSVLNSLKDLDKFNAITVEFHNLYKISEDNFWNIFKSILVKLRKYHGVVFIAPNNCCGYTILGGFPIPNVMEITFAKKSLVNGKLLKNTKFLHPKKMQSNYVDDAALDISAFFPDLIY